MSGLVAAFGAAETAAKKTEAAAKRTGGVYRENARTMVAAERQVVAEAQRSVAAHARAEQQKIRAARMGAEARKRAEQEATRVAQEEARKRGLSAEQEAKVKQNALERYTRIYEQEERRQTRVAEQEARKRHQEMARTFNAWRQYRIREGAEGMRNVGTVAAGVGTVARGALNAAGTAYGMIRDARQQRAGAMRAVTHAVLGGGGTAADVATTQQRVRAFALQTGMSTDAVAEAIAIGQQRGSVLQPGEGQSRAAMLDDVFSTIREANATNTNAGQLLAARGRLAGLGLRGNALKDALRFTVRAADLGSVEVDQIIQQGLPGASRLMATRTAMLGPGATDAERQQAALAAFRESVAFQEVTAGEGNAPRNMANTLANLQTFLRTPRRQEAILTNIRTAEEQANVNSPEGRARRDALRALRESMFEVDPTRTGGAMRMKAGATPLELAARMTQATGGDANAAMSILAGSGRGNPQSLLANMRGVLEFLGRTNASGRTGGARVTEMMGASAVTDAEMTARQSIIEGDDQSRLNRLEETRLNALTNNTASVDRLTGAIDRMNAANPIASKVLPAAAAGAVGLLGATKVAAGGALLTAAGGFVNNVRTAVTGRDLQGNQVGFGERFLRGQAAFLGFAGGVGGAALNAATGVRDIAKVATSDQGMRFLEALPERVSRAIASLQITATVSPTDATHAAQQQPVATPPAR